MNFLFGFGHNLSNPHTYKLHDIVKFLPLESILIETDERLLYWLLQGPKKAHWNNAEIGSHIQFRRLPNIYERGLMYCLNFFYSGKYSS